MLLRNVVNSMPIVHGANQKEKSDFREVENPISYCLHLLLNNSFQYILANCTRYQILKGVQALILADFRI